MVISLVYLLNAPILFTNMNRLQNEIITCFIMELGKKRLHHNCLQKQFNPD